MVVAQWDAQELAAWLRLLLTPSIGNASARRLLARFGGPEQIFAAPRAAWVVVDIRICTEALHVAKTIYTYTISNYGDIGEHFPDL